MDLLDLDKSVVPWIGKTGKMMTHFVSEKFKQHQMKITLEQWVMLKKLHEEDGRMQNDMAMLTNRNKTSLTRLVDTMEKNNLVVRIADKIDRRVNRLYLTKTGKSVFKSTMSVMQECIAELQLGLDKNEIKTLANIMSKVQNNIQNIVALQTKKK